MNHERSMDCPLHPSWWCAAILWRSHEGQLKQSLVTRILLQLFLRSHHLSLRQVVQLLSLQRTGDLELVENDA